MSPTATIIGHSRCKLGESPLWDPQAKVLYWVDSVAPCVWRLDPATGDQRAIPLPDRVGSIVLGQPGELLAGLADGVYRLNLATGACQVIVRPAELVDGERLNDGKTDRRGRYITGSLVMGHDNPIGKLFSFSGGETYQVLPTDPVAISNSICFSPAGDVLYFADSLRNLVWSYAYDQETGALGARRDLIDTSSLGSAPDGATVDAEGFLWVALVQAQKIARFAPDGRLGQILDSPVPFPSCPAFGGEDLKTLFVTSISDSGGRLVSADDGAGRLIAYSGLGVGGIAETRCHL